MISDLRNNYIENIQNIYRLWVYDQQIILYIDGYVKYLRNTNIK